MTDEIKRAADKIYGKIVNSSEACAYGECRKGGIKIISEALLAERRKAYEEILKIIDNWDSEYEYEKWVPEEIANEIRRRMEGV